MEDPPIEELSVWERYCKNDDEQFALALEDSRKKVYIACRHGALKILESLGDPSLWPSRCIEEAARAGQLTTVKWLLALGAKNIRDSTMFYAIFGGHLDVVKWLIESGTCKVDKYALETAKDRNAEIWDYLEGRFAWDQQIEEHRLKILNNA
jgi:hypothetical protein